MQIETEITVECPPEAVFDYIAHAEYLPKYVTEFESVTAGGERAPGLGTHYTYKMARGGEGTFEWTSFEPYTRLAWHGPKVKAGPGSMKPAGSWELTPEDAGTRVKLVMAPVPGGLFKLLSPFLAAGMRKGNAQALERLKRELENSAAG